MTAEIYEKPGEDEDASARGGRWGDGGRERKREEERESSQSLRSKGGRDGENSDKNKGSLSLYLAAFRVALVGGGGGGRIIRARSTFFLLTRSKHGSGEEGRVLRVANISIYSPLPHRFGDLVGIFKPDLISGPNQVTVLFRTSSTRRHAWLAHPGDDPGDC